MNSVGRISGIPTQASNYSTTFTALVYTTTQRTSAITTMSERVQMDSLIPSLITSDRL
jgi:hypothetical protein